MIQYVWIFFERRVTTNNPRILPNGRFERIPFQNQSRWNRGYIFPKLNNFYFIFRMKEKFRKSSFPSAGKLVTEWFKFYIYQWNLKLLVLRRIQKYYTQRFSCKECSFNQWKSSQSNLIATKNIDIEIL